MKREIPKHCNSLDRIRALENENKRLEEENKKLRELKCVPSNLKTLIRIDKENERLEEENKKLKETIEKLQKSGLYVGHYDECFED